MLIDRLVASEVGPKFSHKLASIEVSNFNLRIGVIGEFSSGKSTLLNALLGLNLLPKASDPTTGHITVIEPDLSHDKPKIYARRSGQGDLEITPSDFNRLVLSGGDTVPVLKVPPSDVLPLGFSFVDTPGVESLNDEHTIQLMRGLESLDCVLICMDINRGGLSQSLLNLLLHSDLVNARQHMIFVLTKTDLKPPSGVKRVIEGLNDQLAPIFSVEDLSSKIQAVSAHRHLDQKDGGITKLIETIQGKLLSQHQRMTALRRERLKHFVIKDALFDLEQIHENASLDFSELDEKEKGLKAQRKQLRHEQEQQEDRLLAFSADFKESLTSRLKGHSAVISDPDEARRRAGFTQMSLMIQECTQEHLSRYVDQLNLDQYALNPSLQAEIDSLYEMKNTISRWVTGAVVAAATGPGAILHEAGEVAAVQVVSALAEGKKPEGSLHGILHAVASGIKEINPVEALADMVAKRIAESKAESLIASVVSEHVRTVSRSLESHFNNHVFIQIETQLDELTEQLKHSRAERSDQRAKFKEVRAERIRLISDLKAYLDEVEH